MKKVRFSLLITALVAVGLIACHADKDDPAGQADELSDPVRRENALNNLQRLYGNVLADNEGNREAAPVQEFHDQVAEKLNQAYIDNPADNQNRLTMLELMKEMRDPRLIPALVEALDWRPEVSENHAISAADTLRYIEVPADKKADVVTGLCEGLAKVTGPRPIDNRLRNGLIRALGAQNDHAATECLIDVATNQSEEQNFLFNRLAAQQLGVLADPEAVPALIKALFLFAPNNPAMRMNDVAAEALVRIGRPSLDPLLQVMRGEHEQANAIAEAYIEAVRQRDENAADQMSVAQVTGSEATFTLGALGYAQAREPLMAETESEDIFRRVNGAVALAQLNVPEAQEAAIHTRMKTVYEGLPDDGTGLQARAQLLANMRQTYDANYLDFFLAEAQKEELHPAVRIEAVKAFALLADKERAQELQSWIEGLSDEDGYKTTFQTESAKAIETAIACDEDISCYIEKLGDSEKEVARKAAFMLGRLGRGNAEVINALVEKLGHSEVEVRLSAVHALDEIAIEGSEAAVEKIEELRETEEGRAIWTQFSREALPIEARLRARAQ